MRIYIWSVLLLLGLLGGTPDAARFDDLEVGGSVIDSASRLLLPNIRVDIVDAASGDTLASGIRTDSLGRFSTTITVTAFDEPRAGIADRAIVSVYPSPARSGDAALRYRAQIGDGPPAIQVYDATGRQVGSNITAAGVYFARLLFDDGSVTEARSFVKLPGDPVTLRLERVAHTAVGGAVGKGAERQTIEVHFSHPAYATLVQPHDTVDPLTDLRAAVEPLFTTVEADESTYDVTYDQDTIVLEGSARAALVEADTVNQVYRFDTAALAAEGITLTAGSPMIIEGLALRGITSVSQEGDETVVETEFIPLTNAIESGTISWNHTARVDASAMKRATVAGKSVTYSAPGDSLFFEYEIEPYEFKILLKPSPSDTVRTHMTVEVTKDVDGELAATFIGKGELKEFQSAGDISISNSEAQNIDLENKNVRMEIELSLAAAGSGIDSFNWEMPEVGIPITFTVGPVPVTLNVIVQVVLEVTVLNEASATATTKMSYDGTTGFHYDGTDVDLSQQTVDHLLGQTDVDSGANIGNVVDANLGIAFPKLTAEIFAVPVVPSFLVGFVVGSQLSWGPVCKSGYISAEVKAGLDFELFNLTVPIAEKELWKERKDSAPC